MADLVNNTKSENHHYLPKFYLNGFVDEGEKLHYYRKQYNTYKDVSPAGIYYQKGLNNIDLGAYGFIDLETDFFKEKDNRYAKAFADMRDKYAYDINVMPVQTKADIVEFVLGLYWRVPNGLNHVSELIENEGLLTGELQLYNSETNKYCKDEDVSQIISDIKSKVENQKAFMTVFYEENVRKHDWSKIHEKFLIWKTNKPMLIGDIPYVPIKSECKRGKILEEFVIPLDRNHLLIYALEKPNYLEAHLYQTIVLSIIDGASEKIVCNDLEYLKNEMNFARNRIERLKLLSNIKNVSQLLAPFMKDLCAKFPTYEDLAAWHKLHDYENAGNDFFAQHGL